MKKYYFLALLAAILVFATSCEALFDGADDKVPEGKMRITATTVEQQAKTTLGENYSVLWSEGDEFALFGMNTSDGAGTGLVYRLLEGAGTTTGVFEGDLPDFEDFYALYPVSIFSEAYLGGYFIVNMPTNVIFAERNFVDRANPMVAAGTADNGLAFRNLYGIAELQIKGKGTITSMQIESSLPLAGSFVVDVVNAAVAPYEGAVNRLSVSFDKDIVLEEGTTRNIYALLPPGRHSNLTITTIDNVGNMIVHTAMNDVVIERSKIHTVSEFTHESISVPHVNVTHDSTLSNFYGQVFTLQMNDLVGRVHYSFFAKSDYAALVAEGKSDVEIALMDGTSKTESGIVALQCYGVQGEQTVFVCVVEDLSGNLSSEAVKCEVTIPMIPTTNDYTVSVAGEPRVSASSFEVDMVTTLSQGVYTFALYKSDRAAELSQNMINTAAVINNSTEFVGNTFTISSAGFTLAPGTEYKLYYAVSRGEVDGCYYGPLYTDYSQIGELTIKLPEAVISDAEVELLFATSALHTDVTARSSNALRFKYYLSTYNYQIDTEIFAYNVDSIGNSCELQNGEATIELAPLDPQTTYYIYVLPYGADGNYGTLRCYDFTTLALSAPDAEYELFLGNYQMLSKDYFNGLDNAARNVVISRDVDGYSYLVKGVMNPNLGVANDEFKVRYANGKIWFGHAPLTNAGVSPMIWVAALNNEGNLNVGVNMSSCYNDGNLQISGVSGDITYNGFIFFQSESGGYEGGYADLACDVRFVKESAPAADAANATENFTKGNAVDAGWN